MRFAAKLWYSYVHMPSVIEKYQSDLTLFSYSQDQGADLEQKYSEALLVFRREHCQELADVLKDYTNDGSRVLFIFHPHLEHFETRRCGPRVERSRQLFGAKSLRRQQLSVLQCHRDMKQRFGSHPRVYWKGDMHFHLEGFEQYSAAVAAFMASAMIKPKD